MPNCVFLVHVNSAKVSHLALSSTGLVENSGCVKFNFKLLHICLLRGYQTIIKIVPGVPGPVEGYGMGDCRLDATEESVSNE